MSTQTNAEASAPSAGSAAGKPGPTRRGDSNTGVATVNDDAATPSGDMAGRPTIAEDEPGSDSTVLASEERDSLTQELEKCRALKERLLEGFLLQRQKLAEKCLQLLPPGEDSESEISILALTDRVRSTVLASEGRDSPIQEVEDYGRALEELRALQELYERLEKRLLQRQNYQFKRQNYQFLAEQCLQLLPPGLEQLLPEFITEEISEVRLLDFFGLILKYAVDDSRGGCAKADVCDRALVALVLLAAISFARGEDREATWLMLFSAVVRELLYRGPKRVNEIFQACSTLEQVCARCQALNRMVQKQSRPEMITTLNDLGDTWSAECQMRTVLDIILPSSGKEEAADQTDLMLLSLSGSEKSLSRIVHVTVTNKDDNSKTVEIFYSDTTFGWMLTFATRHLASDYFRVVHKGTTLFLRSSRHKTLQDLGIEHGHEVEIGGVCHSTGSSNPSKETPKTKQPGKNRRKRSNRGKKQKRSPPITAPSGKELAEQYKQDHSKAMNAVLAELGPKLQKIRNRLNNLTLQRSAPKEKRRNTKATNASWGPPAFLFIDDSVLKEAGKVSYPILVGDVSRLYKTSKSKHRQLPVIDLHGCSKEEALKKLDNSLPDWVDSAMRGNDSWVVGVDIICGRGNQILSDAVKNWIRVNKQVANRPKARA